MLSILLLLYIGFPNEGDIVNTLILYHCFCCKYSKPSSWLFFFLEERPIVLVIAIVELNCNGSISDEKYCHYVGFRQCHSNQDAA